MKLTIPADELAAAASWATAAAVPDRPTSPVLAGLLLDADGDALTLTGFDYETSAVARLTAQVGEPGRAVISAKLLSLAAASLPDDLLGATIATDGTRAVLTAGPATYTLMLLPPTEFPEPPAPGPSVGEFAAAHLASAVAQVVPAASKDDTLPVLTHVHLSLDGKGTATLAATDRYRIAIATCPYTPADPDASPPGPVLVRARELAAVMRKPAGTAVTVGLDGGGEDDDGAPTGPSTIALVAGDRKVTMRLGGDLGNFPRVGKFIPDPDSIKAAVTVDIAAMAAAVKRAALVAARNTPVRLTPVGEVLHLEAGTGDEAGYAEDVAAQFDGEPLPIAFNPAYFLDVLNAIAVSGATAARISLTAPDKPGFITPAGDPPGPVTSRHVLVPIRNAG
jgi:DNA polymerase-3 subunit beta